MGKNADLAMYFKTSQGIIIVTGCCHSGLVNTCEYVLKITLQNKIKSITGGFHLLNASPDRMEKTIDYFKRKSIESLIPLHCTSKKAVDLLSNGLGEVVTEGHVGTQISFNV